MFCLNKYLSFSYHIDKLCRKVKSRCGILWRMRNFLSEELALDLYKSLIHPQFAYADIIYDACNVTLPNKLQIHQNWAMRAVLKVDPRLPTAKLYEQTKIKRLENERKERCCVEAYKGLYDLSSNNVNRLFVAPNMERSLRSSDTAMFIPPQSTTLFGSQNLPNWCSSYWQSLPSDLRNVEKLSCFRSALKNNDYFA